MGVLKDEGAGGDGKGGVEALVGVGYFDLLGAGEGLFGLEEEVKLCAEGEVGWGGELDGRRRIRRGAAGEQSDGGAGGQDGGGNVKLAAVDQVDFGGEFLGGFEGRCLRVGG